MSVVQATTQSSTTAAPVRDDGRKLSKSLTAWLLLLPGLLLVIFAFVIPMIIFFRYSVTSSELGAASGRYGLDSWSAFFSGTYYTKILWQTVKMAAIVTALSLCVSYPLAYSMWRAKSDLVRVGLAVVVFLPMLTSSVVRAYGWQILLNDGGPVNYLLQQLALTDEPASLLFHASGVTIAMVHMFLPFVVFPIYGAMRRIDADLEEAAADLGANWFVTFRRIGFPLTVPGILAGAEICFTLVLGSFVIPALLGGGRVSFLPVTIYNDTSAVNWPMASVESAVLLLVALAAVMAFARLGHKVGGRS